MKNCSNCGKPLRDGASFCEECGAVILQSPPDPNGQTCPHCGEKLHSASRFCPNCGKELSSLPARKIPASETKRRRIIGISALAAAAVLAVVIFAWVIPSLNGRSGAPADQFVACQEELFVDNALSSLEGFMDSYGAGSFSSDITLSASVDDPEINRYLTGSSVQMKLDLKQDSLLANSEVTLMDTPFLSGDISYDKGILEVYLPDMSDSRYVMDLSEMISNLSGEDVDLSVLKLPRFSGKEWRSLVKTYLDILYTAVTEESVKVEKNAGFTLKELGGSCSGTVYTFTPRAEDIEAMLLKLAGQLEKDKDLRRLILEAVNPEMYSKAFGGAVFGTDFDAEGELDEGLNDLAAELRENAGTIAGNAAEAFTWSVYLEGKEVRMIRIANRDADEELVFECKGTEPQGRSTVFYLDGGEDGDRPFTISNSYTKKGRVYTGEFSYMSPYDGRISCSYNANTSKKSALGISYGTYELDVSDDDITIKLEVSESSGGGAEHVLTIEGGEYVFDDFSRLELTINTTDKSSAKKPGGEAVDITNYSEEELDELLEELGTAFSENMMEKLQPIME